MRSTLPLALATLIAGCGPSATPPPEFPGAPVVLISIDTLRADRLPAYGYRGVKTPHIDALQQDSILFENAFAHVPLTLPSHLSMLTGLLPAEHGVRMNLGYDFDGKAHPALARVLRNNGYATGGAVSSYVLRGATGIGDSLDFFDDSVGEGVEWTRDVSLLQRPGGETARVALAWVEGVKARPFFLFLHIFEPHQPHDPPEPFRTLYGATYDGEVAASDAIVGEFLEQLQREGIYDRAIIFLVSDHGEGLGDHGEEEHGILLYREVLHVPLLLKLPGSREAGTRVEEPVGLRRIFPTVTSLLGLESAPGGGVSLLERGHQPGGVFSETYYPRIHFGWSHLRSLMNARHHYIDGPRPELYDIVQDPRETNDTVLAEPDVARAMSAELESYPANFEDPGQVDPDVAERLEALGYLSETVATTEGEALPNPRDRIHLHEELKLASRLGFQGRNEEALATLRGVLAEDPGSFEAQRGLAGTLARLGRYQEASAAYQEAMRLSPRLAGTVALPLGLVEVALDRLDEAEKRARTVLAEDPGHALELLARISVARGDLATAEVQARRAISESGAGSEGAMILAQVHLRRSEVPQALAVLDEALARAREQRRAPPTGLGPLRADLLARLGRFAEAEAVLREEIRSAPGRSQNYATLAVVVALQGRPRGEIHDILDSMAKSNASPETILLGAETLDFLGDEAGAREWRLRAAQSRRPPG